MRKKVSQQLCNQVEKIKDAVWDNNICSPAYPTWLDTYSKASIIQQNVELSRCPHVL